MRYDNAIHKYISHNCKKIIICIKRQPVLIIYLKFFNLKIVYVVIKNEMLAWKKKILWIYCTEYYLKYKPCFFSYIATCDAFAFTSKACVNVYIFSDSEKAFLSYGFHVDMCGERDITVVTFGMPFDALHQRSVLMPLGALERNAFAIFPSRRAVENPVPITFRCTLDSMRCNGKRR